MTTRPAVALVVTLFTFASVSLSTAAQAAKTKLLSIGEVVSTSASGRAKLDLVRSTLEQEADAIDWRKSTHKAFVVSVAVVKLETATAQGKVATTCELSTTVRNAKTGAVVAVVSQRARAENAARNARSVEDGAIVAAASAAIRQLPTALKATNAS